MTDLEITKACAEAMGHDLMDTSVTMPHQMLPYDPLNNDAQAMALVKRFGLDLHQFSDGTWVVERSSPKLSKQACESENADLNRAICECVAKMREAP